MRKRHTLDESRNKTWAFGVVTDFGIYVYIILYLILFDINYSYLIPDFLE